MPNNVVAEVAATVDKTKAITNTQETNTHLRLTLPTSSLRYTLYTETPGRFRHRSSSSLGVQGVYHWIDLAVGAGRMGIRFCTADSIRIFCNRGR